MDLADSLGVLNSSIQFAAGQVGNVKDKDWIEKENQKSRDFQLEMWNRANDYNLPQNVMYRYKMAGLNPNLIYDNGTNTQAAYMSAPGHSAPNMGSKDLGRYLNILQSNLVQSEVEKNKAEAYKLTAEGRSAYVRANIDEFNEPVYNRMVNETFNNLVAQGRLTNAQADEAANIATDLYNQIKAKIENAFKTFDATGTEYVIDSYDLPYWKLFNEYVKSGYDLDIADEMVKNIHEQTKKLRSDIDVNKSQMSLNQAIAILDYQLAQTQPYIRQQIASDIRKNEQLIGVLKSQMRLNDTQAKKLLGDLAVAIENYNLDALKYNTTQRYNGNFSIFFNTMQDILYQHYDNNHVQPQAPYINKK